ncbi:MAG: AEC family transporter [Clostridiales bacterium]|nr:AEC family transporter [Clostridiales bacterium]
MFFIVLKNLITLTIFIFIGLVCQKRKLLNDEMAAGLSNLLINVILPCVIITSLKKPISRELLLEAGLVFAASVFIYFFGTLLAWVLCRVLGINARDGGVYLFALTFPNIAYMGFPVMRAALGDDALFYASVATVSFNLLAFTFGISLITKGYDTDRSVTPRKILLNPAIIAIALGLVLFLTSARLPGPVDDALVTLGGMMTPVSMIIIGALLAKDNPRQLAGDFKMYVMVGARLIITPVITFLIFRLFISNTLILGTLVLAAAMPAASITAIFAKQRGANADLASRMVFVTTVLSIASIPLITFLL